MNKKTWFVAAIATAAFLTTITALEFWPKKDARPMATIQSFVLSDGELRNLEAEAHAGNQEAAYRVAMYHLMVYGDGEKALPWFTRAAVRGHLKAQYELAHHFTDSGPEYRMDAEHWLKVTSQTATAKGLFNRYRNNLESLSTDIQTGAGD